MTAAARAPASAHPQAPDDILRHAELLFSAAGPGAVLELRGLGWLSGRSRIAAGWFTDPAPLAAAARALERQGARAVYATLNPVDRNLLARADNKIAQGHSKDTSTDAHVTGRRCLLIDLDPVRPAGISATEAEHAAALSRARDVRDFLAGEGWSAPVLGDSGNGAYLLYRIDLPNDDAARDLVKRVLEGVAVRFDDGTVKVDRGVFNASRIARVLGTMNRKGEDLPERPHRRSALLEVPDPW